LLFQIGQEPYGPSTGGASANAVVALFAEEGAVVDEGYNVDAERRKREIGDLAEESEN
jgi:hypothetical protein